MAARRQRPDPSATVAAVLSFVFPGAGQAYLRRWGAGLAFGLPALVVTLLVGVELSHGLSHLVVQMLDAKVALTVALGSLLLGAWRLAAVIHAWRGGRRSMAGVAVVPILLAATLAIHGYTFVSAAALIAAGDRITSGADGLLDDFPPTGASPAPGGLGQAEDYDDPEPTIGDGPAPQFDVAAIDTHADGLLNVLLVGLDWRPGRDSRRTDTMIVVSVDTDGGAVRMFSFPRDVGEFPLYSGGTYTGKLNGFAGYANRHPDLFPHGGMRSLAHQLGYLLGIPIDYYAAVDIPGFEAVVQAVGGITVYNEREINDHSIDGGEGFRLSVGEHRLSPSDAVKFVRSRKGSSDFARAQRQQHALAALRREILRPERLADLPRLADAISAVLRTDFPRDGIDELLRVSQLVGDRPTENYVFRYPYWATNVTRAETGARSHLELRLDRLAALSRELFGEQSLYR